MYNLHEALGDISSIRRQLAQTTEFRGYGPLTLTATGLLAVAAALAQAMWTPGPANHMAAYLCIWLGTAVIAAAVIGVEMYARTQRIHSGMADEMLRMAVEQFLPSGVVGGLLTIAIVRFVPASFWMLPGFWQVICGLGVFSSCRFLPHPMALAAAGYIVCGLTLIALADSRALSPLAMGIPFAVGQVMVAAILLLTSGEAGNED